MTTNRRLRNKRRRLWQRQKGLCYWCGCKTLLPQSGKAEKTHRTATIDHVIPRAKGGSNQPDNCVMACDACNSMRNELDLRNIHVEWIAAGCAP